MIVTSVRVWLAEQEHKKNPSIFLLEWFAIFAVALLFWTIVFFEIRTSMRSVAMATAVASLYASALVYLRLYKLTACRKCNSPLAFSQEEIARRHVRDAEKCVEIEHGGEEWCEHFVDLYARQYRVEIIKFRCRRCHATWEEERDSPLSDYELVRTINLKD
jgi:hypothetical protein